MLGEGHNRGKTKCRTVGLQVGLQPPRTRIEAGGSGEGGLAHFRMFIAKCFPKHREQGVVPLAAEFPKTDGGGRPDGAELVPKELLQCFDGLDDLPISGRGETLCSGQTKPRRPGVYIPKGSIEGRR